MGQYQRLLGAGRGPSGCFWQFEDDVKAGAIIKQCPMGRQKTIQHCYVTVRLAARFDKSRSLVECQSVAGMKNW